MGHIRGDPVSSWSFSFSVFLFHPFSSSFTPPPPSPSFCLFQVSPGDPTIHLCVGSFREFKVEYLLKSCIFCQRIHWLLAEADGLMLKLDGEGMDMKIYSIDLLDKPDWFLEASGEGKGTTPLCYIKGQWYDDTQEIYQALADEYPVIGEIYAKGGIGDAGLTGNDVGNQLSKVMRWEPGAQAAESRAMKSCLRQLKALNDYLLFDAGPYFGGNTMSIADIDMGPVSFARRHKAREKCAFARQRPYTQLTRNIVMCSFPRGAHSLSLSLSLSLSFPGTSSRCYGKCASPSSAGTVSTPEKSTRASTSISPGSSKPRAGNYRR